VDLLFYHLRLHCYFAIELKTGEFQPEYAGKLSFYISAIDGTMRTPIDGPTIGLLLLREPERPHCRIRSAETSSSRSVSPRIGDTRAARAGPRGAAQRCQDCCRRDSSVIVFGTAPA
jgi:hypothetical protein